MPTTSLWKQGLPVAVFAIALLSGCSKKSSTAPGSDATNTIQLPPATPTPASPSQAPGPNAGAKEYVDFGASLGRQKDYDAAIAAFDSAISLDPKFAPAYYNRGYAKSLQDKSAEALQSYDQAIQLDPNYRDAYYQRGCLKGIQGDFAGAIADFQQDVRIDPKFAAAYYSIGHANYFQGNENGAIERLDKALTLDPKFSFCYYIRGLIRHAQGHREDAEADFQKSVGLNFPQAAFWLFICQTEDGQGGLARKDLTDAMAKAQTFEPGQFSMDIGNFLLGQMTQDNLVAKATASQESQREDNLCQAWFYAGMVRRLNGDLAGAKDCFTKAIATDSKGSEEYVEAKRELAAAANT
jgi:tetratricopeptide (TPR) repeat protein